MERVRILIIDDDPVLVNLVSIALQAEGYETRAAYDGPTGLQCIYDMRPNLVLLDIMLPGWDGWEVCRRVRETMDVPIIMLTARRELAHRLQGLSLGADDYVTKPFDIEELVLRVKAVLRRAAPTQLPAPVYYDDGILQIDQARGQVNKNGRPIQLTRKEWTLLAMLVRHADEIVPYEALMAALFPEDVATPKSQLKVYVNALRRKIEGVPPSPQYVVNRRGVGYGFRSRADRRATYTREQGGG